jgi:hypothetical protein
LICPVQSSRTRLSTLSCSSASAGQRSQCPATPSSKSTTCARSGNNRSTRPRSTSTLADPGSGSTARWSTGAEDPAQGALTPSVSGFFGRAFGRPMGSHPRSLDSAQPWSPFDLTSMRAVVAMLDGRRHSVLVQVAGVVTGGSIHFPEKWTAGPHPTGRRARGRTKSPLIRRRPKPREEMAKMASLFSLMTRNASALGSMISGQMS